MDNRADLSLAEQLSAAEDWWREAGVDHLFVDSPQTMLQPAAPEPSRPKPKPIAKPRETPAPVPGPRFSRASLPGDLAAFRHWWCDPATELPHGEQSRLPPRGEAGAKLMLVVPMPEREDSETLLGGVHGQLLSNIARALQLAQSELYFASALPAHVTLPDWEELAAIGLGEVLAHHIALARPQRVLLFGSRLPLLLGQVPDAAAEKLAAIAGTDTLATFAPERLLDHPRQRARLWEQLLEWTAA